MLSNHLRMQPKKKTKFYNWRAMIRSHSRRIWLWSPMRKEAIQNARTSKGMVQCQSCGVEMRERETPKKYQVDHIQPASEPAAQILNWNSFFERLFCDVSGLWVLCESCHETKTRKENLSRKKKYKRAKSRNKKRG